jgi:hypothetical protein
VTQDSLIVLLLRIGLISGFCSISAWVIVYSRLARWWGNPVGQTLVIKSALLAVLFVVVASSLFFKLNRYFTGWADVTLIGAVTPVMIWRTVVWLRLGRAGRLPHDGHDG